MHTGIRALLKIGLLANLFEWYEFSVYGFLADRAGRRRSLQLSLMVMSVPTILIGMLPTYDQIGGLATVCLLMSRLVQGFGAGSESPVTGCYIFENAEPSR